MKQSRFHQLQLAETALPRRKNTILYHVNQYFALWVRRPVCHVPDWAAVGAVTTTRHIICSSKELSSPQFETPELVIITLLAHSSMT